MKPFRWRLRGPYAVLVASLTLGSCGGHAIPAARVSPDGVLPDKPDCGASLSYEGHHYIGYGDILKQPSLGPEVGSGSMDPCSGGGPGQRVTVTAIRHVPVAHAIFVAGDVYVRKGEPLPQRLQSAFHQPRCSTRGRFAVKGKWLGILGSRSPHGGAVVKAPYAVRVGVEHTSPGAQKYAGYTLTIHVDNAIRPPITRSDIRHSLWRGGTLRAVAHCVNSRFVVESLAATPP